MYRDHRFLLDTAAACQIGLNGAIGPAAPADLVCGGAGNAARVAALYAHWRDAHPEAGPLYWSARTWSQLVWQPIYLSLLGVHAGAVIPRLARLAQSQRAGVVAGFSFSAERGKEGALTAPSSSSPAPSIAVAGRQLRAYLDRQWKEVADVFFLHAKVANRLAADFVMAALLLVKRRCGLGNDEARALAGRWLAATGMNGCSALVPVPLTDGRECLTLERKVCCQHFRRADGALCSTCPKLDAQERRVLLQQELSTAPC